MKRFILLIIEKIRKALKVDENGNSFGWGKGTLLLATLMMAGCTYTKEEATKNMSVDGYILREIDSCEYFMVHVTSYRDGGCYLPIHKNNCRFCKERRQKELEELIKELKEK